MLGKNYSEEQVQKLDELKQEWEKEAEPYLVERTGENVCLDGPDTLALAKLQQHYQAKMREVIENSPEAPAKKVKMKKFSELIAMGKE